MSSPVRLRPARSTDAGKLGAMITAALEAKPWKPRLHSGAQDIAHAGTMIDRGWVTVAEHDESGALLGFIAREEGYVHALFLAPGARGTGLGQRLLDEAKRASGRLELWTFEANTGARRFYRRAGFREVGHGDGSDTEEGLPTIRYAWSREEARKTEQERRKAADAPARARASGTQDRKPSATQPQPDDTKPEEPGT